TRSKRDWSSDVCSSDLEIKKTQAECIGVDHLKIYDDSFRFPDGNAVPQGTPEEIMDAGRRMYTEMSPETADFIKMMFERELFDRSEERRVGNAWLWWAS